MATKRQSNMELLRIVSMLMVLAVHIDGASLGLPQADGHLGALSGREWWQLIVESLAIIGVNCFTLISGYFGIRLKWKSIGKYLFQCVFYAVGIYTVLSLGPNGHFSWKGWGESWMVLTHTDLWYVPAYFGLMLLAPFLNAGFEKMGRKFALQVTLLFVAFNLWAGWWWEAKFNPTGYTIVQLVMMYAIGRCVALYSDFFEKISRRSLKWIALGSYLALSFLTALYACWNVSKAYAYNSPMVVLSSVALLLCFSAIRLRSDAVNYVAKSAFAVYLLHKAPMVWVGYMKPMVVGLWREYSLIEFTIAALFMMAVIYLFAMVVDAVRRLISSLIFDRRS